MSIDATALATPLGAPAKAAALWQTTGLVLPDGLRFEEWEQVGGTLSTMEQGVNWWIGDWLNYGEHAYGEKYAQAIQETGRRYKTLANLGWVAGRIEFSRRRENLSWSHHAEVAGLEPSAQDALLDEAERGEWTRGDLRDAVKGRKNEVAPLSAPTTPPENLPPAGDSTPDVEGDETGFDLVKELETAHAEIQTLNEQVEALSASDLGAEIRRWTEKYARLEGRLQQEIATANEAKKQAKYQGELLRKIRAALGVEKDREILTRLTAGAR